MCSPDKTSPTTLHPIERKSPKYIPEVTRAVANAMTDGLLMAPAHSTKAGMIIPNPSPNTASPAVMPTVSVRTACMAAPTAVNAQISGNTARVLLDFTREYAIPPTQPARVNTESASPAADEPPAPRDSKSSDVFCITENWSMP